MQDFLSELSGFSELQGIHGNKIVLSKNDIIVEMKVAKTHQYFIKMLLDGQDVRSVPFSVLADGYYEPFQSEILIELGMNSTHFLDIGANVGFYSLALMTVNNDLMVDAFEPQPNVFKRLLENVKLNNFSSSINIHNIGLGNKEGELTMFVPRLTGTSGASFYDLHEEEGDSIKIKVPVLTLDSILESMPDLLKIDVEGFELNVLIGAERIVGLSKPTIVVELLRKWMKPFAHTPQMFLNRMFEHNYICYVISEGYLAEIREVNDSTRETNFIFVHQTSGAHKDILIKYAK